MKKKSISIEELVASTAEKIEDIFKKGEQFTTIVLIDFSWILSDDGKSKLTDKNSVGIILASKDAVDARHEIIFALGHAAGILKTLEIVGEPTAIQLASEAWVSFMEAKDVIAGKPIVKPSNDPARREVLVVSGLDKSLKGSIIIKEITKSMLSDASGKVVSTVRTLKDFEIKKSKGSLTASSFTEKSLLHPFFEQYNKRKISPELKYFKGKLIASEAIAQALNQAMRAACASKDTEVSIIENK